MPAEKIEFLDKILPKLQPCESLNLDDGDCVLHAPGFEDRTMDIVNAVRSPGNVGAVLIDYLPFNPLNKLSEVKSALASNGFYIPEDHILKYDRFEPGDFESRLTSVLNQSNVSSVVIDISTMSKLLIILALSVCIKLDLKVRIIYCEAESYGPSIDEFQCAKTGNLIHQPSLQIFSGIHGVVRVDSLASVAMQGQPTAAIVFMSFNDSLTQVLLNTVYPSRLFLINGTPPVHTWREEATAWIHDQVRREWEGDNPLSIPTADLPALPIRASSTLDYRTTVSLLIGLYWELSASYRILLAPSGSKMQAVGSFIVKALHPDIHIEYPSPAGFFKKYSEKIGTRWLLNFGKLRELLSKISEGERQEYLEIKV